MLCLLVWRRDAKVCPVEAPGTDGQVWQDAQRHWCVRLLELCSSDFSLAASYSAVSRNHVVIIGLLVSHLEIIITSRCGYSPHAGTAPSALRVFTRFSSLGSVLPVFQRGEGDRG